MKKHMTKFAWGNGKQALSLILINVLLGQNVVVFNGDLYIPKRVKPALQMVEPIKQMQPPINKQQMILFLGMVTYLFHYMPNISYLKTLDLRGLLTMKRKMHCFSGLRHMM